MREGTLAGRGPLRYPREPMDAARASEYPAVLRDAVLADPRFVRAVFSGPRRGEATGWIRIAIRPVELQGIRTLQFVFYDARKSFARNVAPDEAAAELEHVSTQGFRNIHIELTDQSVHIAFSRRGRPLIRHGKPSLPRTAPELSHNRIKDQPLPEGQRDPYLEVVGIMTRDGTVKPTRTRKFRQINEFIRLVTALPTLGEILERPLRIADLGCGNAYLSFAAYHYLHHKAGTATRLVGVDVQAEIVERNRAKARELGWTDDVSFECMPNADFAPAEPPHVVLALHACDTACDEALARAVQWQSQVIAAATCCHHHLQVELKQRLREARELDALNRHGLLRERLGDVLTDTFRVALLRALGYRTSAVEFVSPEHTPRNLLIRAERMAAPSPRALEEYDALRAYWNVVPRLETLLSAELELARSARHA